MCNGTVTVRNDGDWDLIVTICDRNTARITMLWAGHLLKRHGFENVTCEIDPRGFAHLEWVAVRRCDATIVASATQQVPQREALLVTAP